MTWKLLAYILAMALVTYLLRAVPMVLIRKKVTSPYFKSFFHYIPYTILAAMTLPAIFSSTGHLFSAALAFVVAVIVALLKDDLLIVAIAACAAAYAGELLLTVL